MDPSPAALVDAAGQGDRRALAGLLSTVERGGPQAREVGRATYPLGGSAFTVGITGAPGAGKSTLTGRLVTLIRSDDPHATPRGSDVGMGLQEGNLPGKAFGVGHVVGIHPGDPGRAGAIAAEPKCGDQAPGRVRADLL